MNRYYIALGYDCNHKCVCCPLTTFDRLHTPLGYEQLEALIFDFCKEFKIVEEAKDSDSSRPYVVISGGEPTLYKDFLKVLDVLARNHADITVLSNASTCADKEFVRQMKHILGPGGMDRFEYVTAIHSSSPSLHDDMTGTVGSLWQTVKGLDHLVEQGFHVTLKHIINKLTYRTMEDTFRYLDKHFPVEVKFQLCSMDYNGRCAKNMDRLFVCFDELQPYVESVLDLLEESNKKRKQNKKRTVCLFETPLCLTDPYYWKFYTTLSGNLSRYIAPNDESEEKCSKDISSSCGTFYKPCNSCIVKPWCQGAWRSAYEYGGNRLFRPIKEEDSIRGTTD